MCMLKEIWRICLFCLELVYVMCGVFWDDVKLSFCGLVNLKNVFWVLVFNEYYIIDLLLLCLVYICFSIIFNDFMGKLFSFLYNWVIFFRCFDIGFYFLCWEFWVKFFEKNCCGVVNVISEVFVDEILLCLFLFFFKMY